MTNSKTLKIAGKTALIAALMGGSSMAFAQDAAAPAPVPTAPAAVVPAAPAPAAPPAPSAVTPPPAVRTLPTANDTINPAAAQAAEAETAEKRTARVAAPVKPRAPVRAAAPVAAAPSGPIAADDSSTSDAISEAPAVDAIEPAAAVAESADVASAAPEAAPTQADDNGDDVAVIGGLAAALAALGIGVAAMSRRRRKNAHDGAPVVAREQSFVAPRPIREDPAFAPFAATPAAAPAPAPAPAAVSRNEVSRAPAMTRPDVPVTDPLFSRPAPSVPITDPLFAPRNDVQTPITDPLFARHDKFAGRTQPAPIRRETELVN